MMNILIVPGQTFGFLRKNKETKDWYLISEELSMVRAECDHFNPNKSLNSTILQGKTPIPFCYTVSGSSHSHWHVLAGDPDKLHSQRGDWWSVDSSVPSERSQTPCFHAPMSPIACRWRLQHWHTHLPCPVYGSRQQRYRADRNSHALMLSEAVWKVISRNTLTVLAHPFSPFQLVTGGLKGVVSGEN